MVALYSRFHLRPSSWEVKPDAQIFEPDRDRKFQVNAMVAPLLCGSLLGGLPAFTVIAFFVATVFKNSHVGQLDPQPAAPLHLHTPTLQEMAPFLLFLFLLACDLMLKVTRDRQVCGCMSVMRMSLVLQCSACRRPPHTREDPCLTQRPAPRCSSQRS